MAETEERAARIAAVGYDVTAQERAPVAACNLCGAAAFVVLSHRDRYGYPVSASACWRCGLTFLDPQLSGEAYAAFYAGVYRPLVSAYHGRRIDAETIEPEQRDYAAGRGHLLAPFAPRGGSLLDVGGSTGVVAAALAERFTLRAAVLDPSPEELERAAARGLETIPGLLETWAPDDRTFDLVTVCQTVDHLLDVAGSLAKLRGLVAPDGALFVDIVDLRAAYLRHWSVEEAIKVDHPYYLTEETMRAYLARAGFAVVRTEYAADKLHIGFVARPAPPQPEALPDAAVVRAFFREVRLVHNAPSQAPSPGGR